MGGCWLGGHGNESNDSKEFEEKLVRKKRKYLELRRSRRSYLRTIQNRVRFH